MDPILTQQQAKRDGSLNQEMADEQNQTRPETDPFNLGDSDLTVSQLLGNMYYRQGTLDPNNVSLQSSFICMLHLANEEGLQFGQDNAFANKDPATQTRAESDFTIQKVQNRDK